jgi:MoaA/NifB/PqqE/SkfB family radical SAM enzyme
MKNYAIVGFIYSQACPLACNFCCHTPAVVGKGKFTPEILIPIIQDFSRHPSVTRFAFSGGDPFLFCDEIIATMSAVRANGVSQPFHIVTSGFWADEDEKTAKLLSLLVDCGLDAIDVSYDVEHARYVPRENIYRISQMCERLNVRLEVFGNFWNQDECVQDLLPSLNPRVPVYSSLVMPIGAARVHFHGKRYNLDESKKYSCGKPRVYDVAVYPDGSVYPCCSGGFNKEAKLECGNVYNDSAENILSNVFLNFHARIAKEIGFNKLYEHIRLRRPELLDMLPKFDSVDSVCEVCRDIHRNPEIMKQLESVYETLEVEYVLERAEQEWLKITGAVKAAAQQ